MMVLAGRMSSKEFAVHRCNDLPIFDAREEDARAHDVLHRRAGLFERGGDDLKTAPRLRGASPRPTVLPSGRAALCLQQ
jgi:hypothetical protein